MELNICFQQYLSVLRSKHIWNGEYENPGVSNPRREYFGNSENSLAHKKNDIYLHDKTFKLMFGKLFENSTKFVDLTDFTMNPIWPILGNWPIIGNWPILSTFLN